MIKKIAFLLLLTSFNIFSQVKFEKGYFIDTTNKKTECLIKNEDWRDNPEIFFSKLEENAPIQENKINGIIEFGVYDKFKFVLATTKIDQSSENISELNDNYLPQWKDKVMFLKVLVEGDANLYEYIKNAQIWFYYKTKNDNIEQLIHKKYLRNGNDIAYNNTFQNQIIDNVIRENGNAQEILKLKYTKKNLLNYFIKYNSYSNRELMVFNKESNSKFNLNLKAGLNFSNLTITGPIYGGEIQDVTMPVKLNPNIALEFEYILPFNNDKWSIYAEANYQNYTSEYQKDFVYSSVSSGLKVNKSQIWNVKYSTLNIPIGVRYSLYVNKSNKFYVGAEAISSLKLDSEIYSENKENIDNNTSLDVANLRFAFGPSLGYCFGNKYGIELKFNKANILDNYFYWNSKYSNFTLNFTYTIFNKK